MTIRKKNKKKAKKIKTTKKNASKSSVFQKAKKAAGKVVKAAIVGAAAGAMENAIIAGKKEAGIKVSSEESDMLVVKSAKKSNVPLVNKKSPKKKK